MIFEHQFKAKKILLLIALIILVGGVGYYFWQANSQPSNLVACTMEAKLCPDGTAVGRTGPNCEFAPCPVR
ncbi:MAG: hypothetical protein PHW95_03285 [Patescibacteria group bacterium]|nr:hypothetical protein [Patescibacteria group bacterium]